MTSKAALIDSVAFQMGSLIPAEAVHHGWNVADLSVDYSEEGERWSVRLIGPVEAHSDELTYVGGSVTSYLQVHTGSHGVLRARTSEDLIRLVHEWIEAVWGR